MDAKEKAEFIVKSIETLIKENASDISMKNKVEFKKLLRNKDKNRIIELIDQKAVQSMKAINEFESKTYEELDNMTLSQYFDSFVDIEQFIDLCFTINRNHLSAYPNSLVDKLESLNGGFKDQLNFYLKNILIGPSGTMSDKERAGVQISGITKSDRFVEPLIKLITSLNEKADYKDFEFITDALVNIGLPGLEPIVEAIEKYENSIPAYAYLLMAIGRICSEHKSDRIYQFLKDRFRKSSNKLIEASALSIYGDWRIIAAIRGHVERNIKDISQWEYIQYSECVESLGGDLSDLDEYFIPYDYEV